jgi:hypothetical protein
MSLASNKIILANAQTNTAGAFYLAYAAGNATVTLPAGIYVIPPTANVTIEINKNTDGNVSNASWAVIVANNTGGTFIADGTNVRANVLAGTPTITLFATNGGQAVSGTFNS